MRSVKLRWVLPLLLLLLIAGVGGAYLFDPEARLKGLVLGDPIYQGRPASAWEADLRHSEVNVRVAAVGKLVEGKAEALPVLQVLLTRTGHPEPRWRAADAVGQIGADARPAAPGVIALLDDPDPNVRMVAARALEKLAPDVPGAVPALVAHFPDVPAIRAVAKFGPAAGEAIPKLTEQLASPDADVRWNAAWALGKLGSQSAPAVPAMLKLLTDPDALVRERTAEAIGGIGPSAEAAIPYLVRLLDDEEWKVRRDAVKSLGEMKQAAKSHLTKVQQLKTDPEDEVKAAATRAERLIDPSLAGKK